MPAILRHGATSLAAALCLSVPAFAQAAPVSPSGASGVASQGAAKGNEAIELARPSAIAPAGPATWDAIESRGPTVDYELGVSGGWYYMPPFLQWRFLDPSEWATTDPIVEVHVYPPYSGSATNIEAFLLQIPTTLVAPPEDRALVIGFHGSSLSPAQIFGVSAGITDLPEICTANGWFLLAPNGHHASNMASEPNQRALEVDIAFLAGLFQFNWNKVYTLGFSMGGLNATSFAFRHQDPFLPRVAGIIYHSATTDIVRDYDESSVWAQENIFEDPLVFGASPTEDPYGYDRVNPARFNAAGTGFLDEYFQLDAIKHTPIYVHANYNDTTKYSGWTMMLANTLAVRGFTLKTNYITTTSPTHSIFTLDYDDAIDYVSQWDAGTLPSSAEIYADRPGRYLWTEMISNPAPSVAQYDVQVTKSTNSFSITGTRDVDSVGLNLGLMELDSAATITFTAASADGTSDTYVLGTYALPPSSVLVDGGPPASWSYDGVTGKVSVTPNATGASATIQIVP